MLPCLCDVAMFAPVLPCRLGMKLQPWPPGRAALVRPSSLNSTAGRVVGDKELQETRRRYIHTCKHSQRPSVRSDAQARLTAVVRSMDPIYMWPHPCPKSLVEASLGSTTVGKPIWRSCMIIPIARLHNRGGPDGVCVIYHCSCASYWQGKLLIGHLLLLMARMSTPFLSNSFAALARVYSSFSFP